MEPVYKFVNEHLIISCVIVGIIMGMLNYKKPKENDKK